MRKIFIPKASYKTALLRIGRYLMNTRNGGKIKEPTSDSLKLSCDADFIVDLRAETAQIERIQKIQIRKYAGFTITWSSKMKTETA